MFRLTLSPLYLAGMAMVIFLVQSCTQPNTLPPYTNQQLDTISKAEVIVLQNNFHAWLEACSEKCPPLEDANNVWFSLESLVNYLSYAQHLSTTNPNMQAISGIRLYIGKNAANELTVVASATKLAPGGTSGHRDNPDIGFGVLNYGHAGQPPKKTYPHQ